MPNSISHGHVREAAQIHEDDETDNSARMTPQTRMPTLPTTPLSAVEPNVVRISPFQRSVKRMTPPSLSPPPPPPPRSDARHLPENESFGSSPPPIPVRSARRPSPSPSKRPGQAYLGMTGSHPFSAAPSITSSPGLSAAVQRQFGPTSRYVGLAAALDQAASPASSPDHSSMLRSRRQGVVGGDESSRVFV
ncbi:hypothetical protein P8C59_009223 [Phyllachora maydis]|uniref:Uncharacterized protein n=1 Tax=Phyllachora maydis TaxID=1825666 RepID=A0AAD9IDN9_9PEZI|nr:hypothetical protein P8C59_009223 [Phyllachora maydis]